MVKNENKNFAYTETMEDKILRIVRNEILEKDCFCGTIDAPQMSRQSERSA